MTDLYILPGLDGTTRMLDTFVAAARDAGRQLLAGIANAREVALDGPHLLLQTRTGRCVEEIASFIATLQRDTPHPSLRDDAIVG